LDYIGSSGTLREGRAMSELTNANIPSVPIAHVVPEVSITASGVTFKTNSDLTVEISRPGYGQVTLTQEQYLAILRFSQLTVHEYYQ
jgi:hypothetical protein